MQAQFRHYFARSEFEIVRDIIAFHRRWILCGARDIDRDQEKRRKQLFEVWQSFLESIRFCASISVNHHPARAKEIGLPGKVLRRWCMFIPYYQVLAFTRSGIFAGNPAGVCVLSEWLPIVQLQAIAAENNLPETAFIIERKAHFDLRWLTPKVEVDLCGHATLASAHVIFHHLARAGDTVSFQSRERHELTVARVEDRLVLDFPSQPVSKCEPPKKIGGRITHAPEIGLERDAIISRSLIAKGGCRGIGAGFRKCNQLDAQGVIVTAPGNDCDFVSRYFAPQVGIPEDPVTGSTHCALIPHWSKRLGKQALRARQLSKRGGELFCEDRGERVGIGGNAVTYVEGKLHAS